MWKSVAAGDLKRRGQHWSYRSEICTCVCVTEKQFLNDSNRHFCGRTPLTHTETAVQWRRSAVTHTHMHACRHKSQCFYKGSDGLKEDPAGYYGMPGICWGNIGLPVWACRARGVWIALFHSLPLLPTSLKRSGRREKKKKHWVGGWGGPEQEMSVCGATQERRVVFVCVCCWGRASSALSSSALIQR